MMIPTIPCTNFIIRKTGLTLGSLDAIFYTMLSFDDTSQFIQRCIGRCIGKVIIISNFVASFWCASNYQKFFNGFVSASFSSSNNTACNNLHSQRTFFTIPNINFRPIGITQRRLPFINSLKRLFGLRASTTVSRRFAFKVANVAIGWNGQKVLFAQTPQIPAKTARTAHFIISGYPFMRKIFAVVFKHIQRQFMTSLIANMFRNAAFLSANFIFDPIFRNVQTLICQSMLFARSVTHVNTNLSIIYFAKPTQPLTLYTNRITATFFMSRWIKNNDTVIFTDFNTNLASQLLLQWLMIPRCSTYEFLKRLWLPVVAIGNRLDILSLQVRQKAEHINLSIAFWFTSAKRIYKRLSELFQSFQHTINHLRLDISLFKNFLFSYFKSSLHNSSFPWGLFPWKVIRINDLDNFNKITQYS